MKALPYFLLSVLGTCPPVLLVLVLAWAVPHFAIPQAGNWLQGLCMAALLLLGAWLWCRWTSWWESRLRAWFKESV